MKKCISHYIPQFEFSQAFELGNDTTYNEFLNFAKAKLSQALDSETKITALSISNSWRDAGGNIHVRLEGLANRREDQADFGGIIVWLKRIRCFRGYFYCSLIFKSDVELLADAKRYFFAGNCGKFLSIAKYIDPYCAENIIYKKMKKKSSAMVGKIEG